MAGQRASMEIDTATFEASLAAALKGLDLTSEKIVTQLGMLTVNEAKRFCPVATGRLRSSIAMDGPHREASGPYVKVGTNVTYAPFVEFGTRKMRAQPFLRPALLQASRFLGASVKGA